jgi:hypothetical protein
MSQRRKVIRVEDDFVESPHPELGEPEYDKCSHIASNKWQEIRFAVY